MNAIVAAVLALAVAHAPRAHAPRDNTVLASPSNLEFCVMQTRRELKSGAKHAFECVSILSQEIVGAVLKPSGAMACTITGDVLIDDVQVCVDLIVCGARQPRSCTAL